MMLVLLLVRLLDVLWIVDELVIDASLALFDWYFSCCCWCGGRRATIFEVRGLFGVLQLPGEVQRVADWIRRRMLV